MYSPEDYDYHLPKEQIAQVPADPRDHSRLLVYERTTGKIKDVHFYELSQFLPPQTSLVVNNSKVEKARMLFGNKEVFVLHRIDEHRIEALVRPGKKFKKGLDIELVDGLLCRVEQINDDGTRILFFNKHLDDPVFHSFKKTPFPPYIKPNEAFAERYQTIYAKDEGSKAAPTAGLHFTDRVFKDLSIKGIQKTEVTLHVGLGTFAPLKMEDIRGQTLHSERIIIGQKACEQLNKASHITAVGTTAVRVLESAVSTKDDRFQPVERETQIFIYPGYSFKKVDAFVTNFHLPKSSLLMLISAFMGYEETKRVYRHAVDEKYRFFSFGDAMLIV